MSQNPHISSVSVIVPVYNESENVGWVLEELRQFLFPNFQHFEILVVDDGSSDNTWEELSKIADANIKAIKLNSNMGQSQALMIGIREAKYELCVLMDGDGQYLPTDIMVLMSRIDGHVRLVSGKRDNRKDSFLYRKSSLIGNQIIAWFFGTQRFDLGCGLKVGYKNDFLRLPYFRNIHRYLPILYIHSNLPVTDVEIGHRERKMGKSKYSIWKVFNILPRLFWLKFTGLKMKDI